MRRSLKKRLLISFISVISLTTLIIAITSYNRSVQVLKEKVSQSFSETLSYIGYNLEQRISKLEELSDYIFINDNLKAVLLSEDKGSAQYYLQHFELDSDLQVYSIAETFSYITAIRVYKDNQNQVSYGEDVYWIDDKMVMDNPLFVASLDDTGKLFWTGIHEGYFTEAYNGGQVISLYRPILDYDLNTNIGVLYMSISSEFVRDLIESTNMTTDNPIYITDQNERIVYHPDETLIGQDSASILVMSENGPGEAIYTYGDEKVDVLVDYYSIEQMGWSVYGLTSIGQLTEENKEILLNSIVVSVAVILLSTVIILFTLNRIFKPITQLVETMKSVQEDQTYVKVDYLKDDEIGLLGQSFNYMVDRLHKLFARVLSDEMKRSELEFRLLQSQINPHFISNTLNAIRWMAIIQKADNIKEAVDVFGRLLTKVNRSIDEYVTIEEEISNLKDYVYIEKLRYGDKFRVEYNIEPQLLEQKCLKFILQPIVENAIFHGIEPLEGEGVIQIEAFEEASGIIMQVIDNGVGFSEEDLDRISRKTRKTGRGLSGIGLKNIDERIKLIYGEDYGMTIKKTFDRRTCIEVVISFHEALKAVEENV